MKAARPAPRGATINDGLPVRRTKSPHRSTLGLQGFLLGEELVTSK